MSTRSPPRHSVVHPLHISVNVPNTWNSSNIHVLHDESDIWPLLTHSYPPHSHSHDLQSKYGRVGRGIAIVRYEREAIMVLLVWIADDKQGLHKSIQCSSPPPARAFAGHRSFNWLKYCAFSLLTCHHPSTCWIFALLVVAILRLPCHFHTRTHSSAPRSHHSSRLCFIICIYVNAAALQMQYNVNGPIFTSTINSTSASASPCDQIALGNLLIFL